MAGFAALPVEIYDQIFFEIQRQADPRLTHHDDRAQKSLHSLCLVSQKCTKAATALLYRHLNTNTINIPALLRTLCRRQSLASFVHKIEIQFGIWRQLNLDIEDLGMLDKLFNLGRDWQSVHVDYSTIGQQLCLKALLYLTSNLQDVVFSFPNDTNLSLCKAFFGSLTSQSPPLRASQSLRSVDIDLSSRKSKRDFGFALGNVSSILHCANHLRVLCLHACLRINILGSQMPGLMILRLKGCALVRADLFELVRTCPNLQSFEYETGTSRMTKPLDDIITSRQLTQGIYPLRNTLSELIINQQERDDWRYDENEPISSLAEFTRLKLLVAWQNDLTQPRSDWYDEIIHSPSYSSRDDFMDSRMDPFLHKLPKSLQILRVTASNEMLEDELLRLASGSSELPGLQSVQVDHRYGEAVSRAFQSANLQLDLKRRYGFKWHVSIKG